MRVCTCVCVSSGGSTARPWPSSGFPPLFTFHLTHLWVPRGHRWRRPGEAFAPRGPAPACDDLAGKAAWSPASVVAGLPAPPAGVSRVLLLVLERGLVSGTAGCPPCAPAAAQRLRPPACPPRRARRVERSPHRHLGSVTKLPAALARGACGAAGQDTPGSPHERHPPFPPAWSLAPHDVGTGIPALEGRGSQAAD